MNNLVHRIAGVVMALILTLGVVSPGHATSQTALMPDRIINIAHFYKPPKMAAATAIKHFGSIVLTNGDQVYLEQLRNSGFDSHIPEYFRSEAIQNPGSCTAEPLNNQAAYKRGDFCNISKNHPDWFLRDKNGKRIRVTDSGDYFRMDPANPEWRKFFLDRVIESQNRHEWSGLFLDNVEASLGKFYTVKPVKYKTDASYQDAVAGFLKYLHENYSQKYNRPIIGNIVTRYSKDDATWFRYLQFMDGAMQERFAVDWHEKDYLSESSWLRDMNLMAETQAQGKYVILVSTGYKDDTRRQKFAFASYLLISDGKAAFRYANFSAYRQSWLYSNYKLDLGKPLGERYKDGDRWRRDFTNGYVIVNPVKRTANIVMTSTTANSDADLKTEPVSHTYNDQNKAFVYSPEWTEVTDATALKGEFMRTVAVDSSVTLPFTGNAFTVVYKSGPTFGKLEVYVDGSYIDAIDQRSDKGQAQQKWSYSGLADGGHELKLVFIGPDGAKGSLDAVTIP